MKTKEIIKHLEEIKRIANFQAKRIKDKNAFKREEILSQSLDIIQGHANIINKSMNIEISTDWCCENCGELIIGKCYNKDGYVTHLNGECLKQ